MLVKLRKRIGGFRMVSVRFLEDIGLEDIVLKDIQQLALGPSPILERVLERISPGEDELFNSLCQNHFQGDIELIEKPILYCDDNIDLMFKVCLKMVNGGYFVWKPQHKLWEVVFTITILDQQKGTWITSSTQSAFEVEGKEDFFLVPLHMHFKMNIETSFKLGDEKVLQLCKTMDALYDWTQTKKFSVRTMVLLGVQAYSHLLTDIISYYESRRCTTLINSFILKQCQSKNSANTAVGSFFEKVEQLKKCHGCFLILDQLTTWFRTEASENLAQCAEIIQRFTQTTGNCLILLSTLELPQCLDNVTHIVLNAHGKITKHSPVENVVNEVNAWFETKTQTLPAMLSNLEKAVVQRELEPSKVSTEFFENVLTYFPSIVPCQKNEFKRFLSCVFKSPFKNHSPRFLLKADHGKGKTALCHALKTLKGLTMVPIVMSDLIFSAFGVSQKYLKHLFHIAQKNVPSILLIEDIENFTRHSANDTCKWGDELVSYLCTLIDGLPGTTVCKGKGTVGIMITTSDSHNNVKKMFATRFFLTQA